MPRAKAGGYISKRIALDSLDVRQRIAEQLKVIADDITDGDSDTSRAQRAVAELNLINLQGAVVDSKIIGGNLPDAELAMTELAACQKER